MKIKTMHDDLTPKIRMQEIISMMKVVSQKTTDRCLQQLTDLSEKITDDMSKEDIFDQFQLFSMKQIRQTEEQRNELASKLDEKLKYFINQQHNL